MVFATPNCLRAQLKSARVHAGTGPSTKHGLRSHNQECGDWFLLYPGLSDEEKRGLSFPAQALSLEGLL